jgi:NitT/TauT family transport system substrate-binding protein/putative hydroxymethylpyrimidine transport system substrate-binding protein
MKRVAAPLAAALLASAALAACGGSGAEPGASNEATAATLVLDFQPNAVHAGIYAAEAAGYYKDAGVDLSIHQPSASTDAPKLLESGRAQFAILDIHDLGLAAEKGFDVVGVMPIVQRPLASVLAQADISRPRDLEGKRVGVTGLPSDDAVLDSVVSADGGDPSKVDRVTIGFNAVSALAAGKVDAATAFWNAEGVTLQQQGFPIREFRVDDYGAPKYPELVLVTSSKLLSTEPNLVRHVVDATKHGYGDVVADPPSGLGALLAAVQGLDRGEQQAELDALTKATAFSPPGTFDRSALDEWSRWDTAHGILSRRANPGELFALGVG